MLLIITHDCYCVYIQWHSKIHHEVPECCKRLYRERALESGFRIVRYRMLPGPHLENIDSGRREKLSDVNASYGGSKPRLRVTMYIINDTRAG